MPRAMPVRSAGSSRSSSGPSVRTTCAFIQAPSRPSTFSSAAPVRCSSAISRMRGEKDLLARLQLRHRFALPADGAVVGEDEGRVGRRRESIGSRLDLAREALHRRVCAASSPRRWTHPGPARRRTRTGVRRAGPRRSRRRSTIFPLQASRSLSSAASERWSADRRTGWPGVRAARPTACPLPHAPRSANAPDRATNRGGWRRRSRSGPARFAPTGCRCPRPPCRAARYAVETSRREGRLPASGRGIWPTRGRRGFAATPCDNRAPGRRPRAARRRRARSRDAGSSPRAPRSRATPRPRPSARG